LPLRQRQEVQALPRAAGLTAWGDGGPRPALCVQSVVMCPEDSADAPPPTHVVAAVLEDLRGRVLLTRRTAHRDFAGLWEFPGGKVEPGESPSEALKRELHEELGIEIKPTVPLISVPCAVPTKRGDLAPVARKRLILDVHHTTTWTGRPHGREGQATIWVPRDRL